MHYLKELVHYNAILTGSHTLQLGVACFFLSILLACLRKYTAAIFVLVVASTLLNRFIIHLDPFLNSWDERFHCLVAKSLIAHPLIPSLYTNPILPFDYKNWSGNQIWLHKQPLFLWQMALAIKVFGVNEVAARIPSALMVTLLCPVLFRMGYLLAGKRVGYIAALLCASNNFILEHVSGKHQIEHNDVAFMFYITLSVWAWLEFEKSGKMVWLLLTGIFSGCSILIKWVTGLLVFAGFGFYHLLIKHDLFKRVTLTNVALALLFAVLIALPWQVYIFTAFPAQAQYEYQYNSLHFFKVLENHGGSFLFYFKNIKENYNLLFVLLIPSVLLVLFKGRKYPLLAAILFMIAILYIFFSVAATKMISFVMPVAPLCFLVMAFGLNFILQLVARKGAVAGALTFILLGLSFTENLNVEQIAGNHWRNTNSYWGKFLQNTADNTVIYKDLNRLVANDCVIAYCNQFEEIDCIYFSGITAYSYLDNKNFELLKKSGKKIAVFRNNLPDFVLSDSSVYIIPVVYKSNPSL